VQNLDGGASPQVGILGLIDLAKTTLAEQTHDLEVSKALSDCHNHAS
jgi:hypothetical protein